MLKYGFAILICGVLSVSSAVHVEKCREVNQREGTHGAAKLEDVRVSDCDDPPCTLRKGTDVTVEFDFISDKDYTEVVNSVFGGIGIIRVPFRDVHMKDACKDIVKKSDGTPGCPLAAGEEYTYKNTFPIIKSYPAVNVNVQYGINSGKDPVINVVCFTLPSKITNA